MSSLKIEGLNERMVEQFAYAIGYLQAANDSLLHAKTAVCTTIAEMDRLGNVVGKRKCTAIYDNIRTQMMGVQRAQIVIMNRLGFDQHEDCMCGYAVECDIHPFGMEETNGEERSGAGAGEAGRQSEQPQAAKGSARKRKEGRQTPQLPNVQDPA